MAGEAKTTNFMLGTATVMLGPTDSVFDLIPATHGVGLVKAVTVTSEPSYTDLSQGVQNTLVYSVMTGNPVRAQMEIYEYTRQNINYALGLDGSLVAFTPAATTLSAAVTAAASTISVTSATGLAIGDWIAIEDAAIDKVYFRKITTLVTTTVGFTTPLPNNIPNGSKVTKRGQIDIGSKANQPFLGCKIVGTLANGEPIGLIFPKVRVTKGFNLAFITDNYGNMPFELTMYDLVSTDTLYSQFANATGYAVI